MIVVFYLDGHIAQYVEYGDDDLTAALEETARLRGKGCRHVTISSELESSVGKPGVAAVENGMTPDGHVYDWKKRR